MNPKLSSAIMAALGAHAGATLAADVAGTGEIADIVVTAQRRSESIQNVPIAIQAVTAETLTQLNISTFDDMVKFLPNVTMTSQLPGVGQIYIRGLGTTEDGPQSSGATGSFPNVAIYLDEQSAQLPGRNLDIYAVDMERIEVLEGPQGTLFGAGAQAGVVRYITNKPKLNQTEGAVNASYGLTAHGDPSSAVDATINLPLVPDKFAVRGVVYNEERGGYISNVASTFTRRGTDIGMTNYFGGVVPPNSPVINNENITGRAINPVTYKGIRLSGLWQINDDWSALLTESYQQMRADGVFAQMSNGSEGQPLPELSVTMFNNSYNKDKFNNIALTLNGKFGDLKAVYTGGYLVRDVEQVADYTNYTRGVYATYYQCILPGSPFAYDSATGKHVSTNPTNPGACFSPSATFRVTEKNTHQSHEFRLSTPDDWRVRAIGGLFYEDFKIQDASDWLYKAPEAGFAPIQPPTGATAFNPNVRGPTDAFIDDITRGYKQKAAFASVDFDILPHVLTLTGGLRYYNMDTYQLGSKVSSYGCRDGGLYSNYGNVPVGPVCVNGYGAQNLDSLLIYQQLGLTTPVGNNELFPDYIDSYQGLHKTYKGTRGRVNLTWKVTPDALTYATWSQGFRPGGFNRGSGFVGTSSPLNGVWLPPPGFKPDTLVNTEIGWKTTWLNRRIQFNGAIYQEKWDDVQIGLFDPGVTGNLTFTTNGPNYRVRGIELDFQSRITQGLTFALTGAYNKSELVDEVNLKDNAGNPIDWSQYGLQNPFGVKGTPLAMSPKVEANARLRYDFKAGNYDAFWQVASIYRDEVYSTTDRLARDLQGNLTAYLIPSYTQFDGSIGMGKDAWTLQLYGTNLADKRAITYSSYNQWIKMDTVSRPRTLSLRFGYKFSGT